MSSIKAFQVFFKLFIFLTFSIVEVSIASTTFAIPAEDPNQCVSEKKLPCSISTGDRPRFLNWEQVQWELDRDSVALINKAGLWNFYKGMVVIEAKQPMTIHTPFADVQLGKSKVMIHVLEDRLRVLSLLGEGVKVKPRIGGEEQFLVPGFQNWYAGIHKKRQEFGVPMVFDFDAYAKKRAKFFTDHKLGFVTELKLVAKSVRWASQEAAKIHRQLVERKMASLQGHHNNKIQKKKNGVRFNKYLRELFLKKMRYDY